MRTRVRYFCSALSACRLLFRKSYSERESARYRKNLNGESAAAQDVFFVFERKLQIVFLHAIRFIRCENFSVSALDKRYFETELVVFGNEFVGNQKQISDLPQREILRFYRVFAQRIVEMEIMFMGIVHEKSLT